MRLSRLSDRQLRRLIRNAEVRFGQVDEKIIKKLLGDYASGVFKALIDEKNFRVPGTNQLLSDVLKKEYPDTYRKYAGFKNQVFHLLRQLLDIK